MTRAFQPRSMREVVSWDHETDVLVVGLGCAGAAAAIDAARAGARVTALERASGPGGTSSMSGGVIYLGGKLGVGTGLPAFAGVFDSIGDALPVRIDEVRRIGDDIRVDMIPGGAAHPEG